MKESKFAPGERLVEVFRRWTLLFTESQQKSMLFIKLLVNVKQHGT